MIQHSQESAAIAETNFFSVLRDLCGLLFTIFEYAVFARALFERSKPQTNSAKAQRGAKIRKELLGES